MVLVSTKLQDNQFILYTAPEFVGSMEGMGSVYLFFREKGLENNGEVRQYWNY